MGSDDLGLVGSAPLKTFPHEVKCYDACYDRGLPHFMMGFSSSGELKTSRETGCGEKETIYRMKNHMS